MNMGCRGYWAKVDDDVVLRPGAFDMMISAMAVAEEGGHQVGCCQMNVSDIKPTLLSIEHGQLKRCAGNRGELAGDGWNAVVVDSVGTGSTIFSSLPFSEGCRFEPSYVIGGVDVDMSWQMRQRDIGALLLESDGNLHDLMRCTTAEYTMVRWNPKSINKSGDIFHRRWGIKDPHLKR